MPLPKRKAEPKVRATLYISSQLLDEARNATVHLAGYPVRLTLTKLVEAAVRQELERLKHLYNDDRDFPPREEDLRGGRPIAAEVAMTHVVAPKPHVISERERLRRRLLELILKNEAKRRLTLGKRAGE